MGLVHLLLWYTRYQQMHLFVLNMKVHQHTFFLVISAIALSFYMAYVEPVIEKPFILGGFFFLLFSTVYWAVFLLIKRIIIGRVLFVVAFVLALAIVYLVALSTLNSLGLVDFLMVGVATGLLIAFIIGPLRRRRAGS